MGVSSITYISGVAGDVERVEEIQQIQNENVKGALEDLKDDSGKQFRELQRQNDRLEDKMDKIIDKVISVNGRGHEN